MSDTVAGRYFDAMTAFALADEALRGAVEAALGVPLETVCDDLSCDYYDWSIEFVGCIDPAFRLTAEQREAIAEMGFERCWINWGERFTPAHRQVYYYGAGLAQESGP